MLRDTKAGVPAWAKVGAKASGTAAAVGATLQQHGAAAGVAEPKETADDAAPVKTVPDDTAAANDPRNAMDGGGAAESMDEDGAAAAFDEGAALPPPAKDASPPRGSGARGMKSARAARPDHEEVRNSADRPDRRVASDRRLPRAAATNNTAVDMFRAGGDRAAASAAAQRRRA